jgi:hypothetical protein
MKPFHGARVGANHVRMRFTAKRRACVPRFPSDCLLQTKKWRRLLVV